MKPKIGLRYRQVSDAKRFYEILNNPNFEYFPVRPKSILEEEAFIMLTKEKRKEKKKWKP